MDIIIITGGSKGLGKALTEKYKNEGYQIYSLARTPQAKKNHIAPIQIDLSDLKKSITVFETLLNQILEKNPDSITFINNAGKLGKIDTLPNIPSGDIESTITLNYTTPMVLCSIFIKMLRDFKGSKKIRNISSGAAHGSHHGWSVYCSTKSAMDSFSKTMAVEEEKSPYPVHILSIYPGIIDTEMQAEIRKSKESEFSNVQRFIDMKKNNELSSPQVIADSIYQIDNDPHYESGEIVDVRTY